MASAKNILNEAEMEIMILLSLGHKYEEMAEITDTPSGTIRSRIYNIRKKLVAHLKKEKLSPVGDLY